MILSRSLWIVLLGLGAVAGAVLTAGAQVPARRDTIPVKRDTTTRRDTTLRKDTIRVPLPPRLDTVGRGDTAVRNAVPLPAAADSIKPDTIKRALPHSEAPPSLVIGPERVYDRTALFATGALRLSDLLTRIIGLTEYSTGFIASPTVVASQGDLKRIRLFLDGIELDPMDRRARGIAPVNDLVLHSLEEVRIEVGADEVRVYARTWRVDRTIPYTRADIATGDLSSNLYRAFYGKRFNNGGVMQVAAEEYTTQPDRALPSSDALNIMARLGLQRGPWTLDGTVQRSHLNRAPWTGTGNPNETVDTVPSLQTQRNTSYLRFANGDPDQGRWIQLMASALGYSASARTSTNLSNTLPSATDSANTSSDTVSYESQYLVTGGLSRGWIRLSGAERVRVSSGRTSHVASARATGTSGPLALSLFGEGRSYLDPSRVEGTARFSPGDRVAIVGSAARTGSGDFDRLLSEPRAGAVLDASGQFDTLTTAGYRANDTSEVRRYRLAARTNLRGEAGVRIRDLWVSVGLLRRGPTTLLGPAEFDKAYAARSAVRVEDQATARTISARGRLYRGIQADAWAVKWSDSTGLYRPQYQTRSELFIQTSLLDHFPRGNFGLLTSLVHEYRSNSRFPMGTDSIRISPGYRALTFKLEIRVQTAVVSYQFRNLVQERYSQVPGFNLPRQAQFYGVRWEFWN